MPFDPKYCGEEDRAEHRAEQFWAAVAACETRDALEQRFGDDLLWLESDPRTERWGWISVPGESVHVCVDCGALYASDADLADGCAACGFGQCEPDEDEDDMEMLEAA